MSYVKYDVDAEGLANMMSQAAKGMPEYQWLRELVVNSAEAGATEVRIGPWFSEDLGYEVTRVADNGKSMTSKEVKKYLGNILTTGQSYETNFGWGGRLATIPLNKRGVMYACRTDGEDVQVHLTDKGIREYRLSDGTVDWKFAPYDGVFEPLVGDDDTGTSVLLLGNRGSAWNQDDWYKMMKWISGRFYEFPNDIRITIQGHGQHRTPYSTKSVIDGAEHSGEFPFIVEDEGGIVTGRFIWALHRAAGGKDRVYAERFTPGVGFLHRGEIFGMTTQFSGYFGMPLSRVKNRVQVLVEVDDTAVSPDRSRINIPNGKGGAYENYPYKAIGQEFYRNLPEPIADLIREIAGDDVRFTERMAKMLDPEWRKSLGAHLTKVPAREGKPDHGGVKQGNDAAPGEPGGNGDSHQSGKAGTARPPVQRKRTGDGPTVESLESIFPNVKFVDRDDIDNDYGVIYNDTDNTIYIENEFGPLKRLTAWFGEDHPMGTEFVEGRVREALEIEMVATVIDAKGAQRWGRLSSDKVDRLLSPEALYTKTLGMQSIKAEVDKHLNLSLKEIG